MQVEAMMGDNKGQLSCVEKIQQRAQYGILVEPQKAPAAQQIVDHSRQSAAFCWSKMTAPSQVLNYTSEQH